MKKLIFASVLCCSIIFAQQEDKLSKQNTNNFLLQPITVTIGGDFITTGSFTAYKSQRVDHFITTVFTEAEKNALGALNQIETIKLITKEVQKYSLRDIKVKHSDGVIENVDLLKFRLTGDFKYNPYLMNDDVIIFPFYDEPSGSIEINGAVNKPTKFQFVDGDKLSDAILFAGGINQAYDNVTNADISRLKDFGNKEEIVKVNIKDNPFLQRGDRVRINFTENNKRSFKVLVLGEVNSPGEIYITKDGSTIEEVISKAGGFTKDAWLERAEVLRATSNLNITKMKKLKALFENQKEYSMLLSQKYFNDVFQEQLSMLRMNDLYSMDSLVVIIDNTLRVLQSKSIIDFTKINDKNSDDGKYLLSDGDMVMVPKKENQVYVFGQVNNPGFVTYNSGKSAKYYTDKAGGIGETAESDIKIIKGGSYAWITAKENSNIEPGDFIYVPKSVPRPFEYYLREAGSISSVITAIATIILIVVQASK